VVSGQLTVVSFPIRASLLDFVTTITSSPFCTLHNSQDEQPRKISTGSILS
jgi:hypothetical protein